MHICWISIANFMCSRSDRTAWRADGAAGDHLAAITEAITARSHCLRYVEHPARIAGSLPLDANGLHHLAPLLGFIGDELTEVDRRARKGRSAQIGKPRLDLGIGKARIYLFVERFVD